MSIDGVSLETSINYYKRVSLCGYKWRVEERATREGNHNKKKRVNSKDLQDVEDGGELCIQGRV